MQKPSGTTLCRQSHYSLSTSPATSSANLFLSARRLTTLRTTTTAASNSPCSQTSSILAKKYGITMLRHFSHMFLHNITHDSSTVEDAAVVLELQSGPAFSSKQKQARHTPGNSQGLLLAGTHRVKVDKPQRTMSTGTLRGRKKRQPKAETKEASAADDAVALIPKQVTQRAKQLGKLMSQQQPKLAQDKLETKYSAQIRQKLKKRFQAIVQEAASSAHWKANPAGFLVCLQDIELLFHQLFAPLSSERPPHYCCSVAATTLSVSQCIDRILPVVLTQQGNAGNMVVVAEFLQDMMGMAGSQMFRCFVQEPSVLYLDVYSSLLPLQDLFQTLHWDPADYNQIISRSVSHPLQSPNGGWEACRHLLSLCLVRRKTTCASKARLALLALYFNYCSLSCTPSCNPLLGVSLPTFSARLPAASSCASQL